MIADVELLDVVYDNCILRVQNFFQGETEMR